MGERLAAEVQEDHTTVKFYSDNGSDVFTAWMDSMPSKDDYGYEVYVLHVEDSVPSCRIAGVHAYDDMIGEYDRMVATLESSPPQDVTNAIVEQMIVLLANFVECSRVPTPPEVSDDEAQA